MNVLLAWEFGANYGHVLRDMPVGLRLRELGHEVVFAVRNVTVAAEAMARHGLVYVQAPVLAPRSGIKLPVPRASISERLLAVGFHDALAVTATAQAWLNTFAQVEPDVVVADSAATALLAARVAEIPVLLLGNGYEVPPCAKPMPCALTSAAEQSRLEAADLALLRTLNVALRAFGRPELGAVAELFEAHAAALTTFPELDHYPDRSSGRYVGHIAAAMPGDALEWEGRGTPKLVAYLRPIMRHLERVLLGLQRLEAEVICICPNLGALAAEASRPGCRVFSSPVALGPLLRTGDGVVSYGGAGIVAESLLAGAPLALFPEFTEQSITAERVQALEAGTWVPPDASDEQVDDTLDTFVAHLDRYRRGAAAFSDRHADYSMTRAVEAVATWITEL